MPYFTQTWPISLRREADAVSVTWSLMVAGAVVVSFSTEHNLTAAEALYELLAQIHL